MARERIIGLIAEKPLLVYPSAAKYLGISKAIIIQQLHFWIEVVEQQADPKHFIDGEWWVYNSYADWQKHHFPWLSKVTLKRLFAELENDGLIKSRVIPGRGKKNWYTINVTNWNQFVLSMDKTVPEKPKGIKMIPSGYQNDTNTGTPENTTEEKKKSAPKSGASPAIAPSAHILLCEALMRKFNLEPELIWKSKSKGLYTAASAELRSQGLGVDDLAALWQFLPTVNGGNAITIGAVTKHAHEFAAKKKARAAPVETRVEAIEWALDQFVAHPAVAHGD